MSEHGEQVALMDWATLNRGKYPELELLYAIPNGGARHIEVAKSLKAEGVKPGVPDLCLPVARGAYHGLYIEMKVKPNKPTPAQNWWIEQLKEQSYNVVVCYGYEQARDVIEAYLRGKRWNQSDLLAWISEKHSKK